MVAEIGKTIGQWILENVGWSIIIFLFLLSCLFKITKVEIDPLGWLIGWFGKMLTKDVRKDVADLKQETHKKFEEVKTDRAAKIEELKNDYNSQISELRADLDGFEKTTNTTLNTLKKGTDANCKQMKTRLDKMEKSNDMQTVRQIRAHILDFANSCMNGRLHTKRDFENIMDENAQYEDLVKKYKLKNRVYEEDYAFIMRIYHDHQEHNSFLNENLSDV